MRSQLLGDPLENESPQGGSAFSRWVGRTVLKSMGWKVQGRFPSCRKYIITLAPHTSNWDFVVGVAILLASGLKISFLIKHSLFFWPFSLFLRRIGGVPVDRRAAHGIVGEMVRHFAEHEKMILTIAPEGTRRKVNQWKVGFLHIGHGAKVPVVPVGLDYPSKTATVGDMVALSGEMEKDLAAVKSFYSDIRGKYVS